jgi:hypothetical protein
MGLFSSHKSDIAEAQSGGAKEGAEHRNDVVKSTVHDFGDGFDRMCNTLGGNDPNYKTEVEKARDDAYHNERDGKKSDSWW